MSRKAGTGLAPDTPTPWVRDSPAATGIMSLACSRGGAWDLLTQNSNTGWIMLDGPASTPQGRAEHGGARVLADAGIHAYEVTDAHVPFLIGGFTATVVGAAAGALFLLTRGPQPGRAVGGLTALLTTIGCLVTRATPIPTDEDDHGNRPEPLGICSLVIQGVVVMAVVALSGPAPLRPGRLVQEAKSLTPGLQPDDPGSGSPDEPPTSPRTEPVAGGGHASRTLTGTRRPAAGAQ
ncbi:hypothetical protein ACFYQA_22815 [Streptomyces sp. NPDC005774]|uniref:hypothetical protein n=1 Tax=Streptomyces sp. NPDC005774 TaxID=3364728 RepID=UPI0036BDFF54